MSLGRNKIIAFSVFIAFAAVGQAQFFKKSSSNNHSEQSKPLSLPAKIDFYPSNKTLLRTMEQKIHTSMLQMGEQIEMDLNSTLYTTQKILPPKDSQTLIIHPYKMDGEMILNNSNKKDISQKDSSVELICTVDEMGLLTSISGNQDYIDAMKKAGINNVQIGMDLMVYFRYGKVLFVGDSFVVEHNGKPYSFKKHYLLKEITANEAIFQTSQEITLLHNYDMNGYDVEQNVKGTSSGLMKVRLSDYLVVYNEENLNLEGYMEMVTLNVPISIKGTFKETINEQP